MPSGDPYDDPNSLRFGLRKRRFEKVARLIDSVLERQDVCRIIDLGGTEQYWRIADEFLGERQGRIEIVLVNLLRADVSNSKLFTSMVGDACNLSSIADNAYDLVHSNSLIEHVGSWDNMKRAALEMRRLAPHYYVQTPNFWFPFEPHYNSIAFHWMPQGVQARRLMRKRYGFMDKVDGIDAATTAVQHTTLLDAQQFRFLFPDATMAPEIMFGLTKSLIAWR